MERRGVDGLLMRVGIFIYRKIIHEFAVGLELLIGWVSGI